VRRCLAFGKTLLQCVKDIGDLRGPLVFRSAYSLSFLFLLDQLLHVLLMLIVKLLWLELSGQRID
jgi:hypothetical protein